MSGLSSRSQTSSESSHTDAGPSSVVPVSILPVLLGSWPRTTQVPLLALARVDLCIGLGVLWRRLFRTGDGPAMLSRPVALGDAVLRIVDSSPAAGSVKRRNFWV